MLREEGFERVRAPQAPQRSVPASRSGMGLEIVARLIQRSSALHRRPLHARRIPPTIPPGRARSFEYAARHRPRPVTKEVFRIGHLGDFNDLMLLGYAKRRRDGVGALAGVPHQKGGVAVVLDYLTETARQTYRRLR